MDLKTDEIIDGKYRIARLIGRGGMGNVYEGENIRIQRRVAIKVLNARVAEDRDLAARFEREARAAGRIGSAHIVEVLDLGELPDGAHYMVMEFLEGDSLRQRMDRRGTMSPAELFPIIVQLLDGLADAHAAGILHRDLKPANVILVDDRRGNDFVKIVDFGVSKFLELDADDMTATGQTLGTPRYMSPEQAKGEKNIDARADVYSVGVILYRALSGRPPFVAETYNELMFKVALEDPPSLDSVVEELAPGVTALVAKSMGRDREQRFESAVAMRQAISEWLENSGHPVGPAPRRRSLSSSGTTSVPVLLNPLSPAAGNSVSTKVTSSVAVAQRGEPRRYGRPLAALALFCLGVGALAAFANSGGDRAGASRAVQPPPRSASSSAPLLNASAATAMAAPSAAVDAAGSAMALPSAGASASAGSPSATAGVPTSVAPPMPASRQPAPPASGPRRKFRRAL